MLRSLRTRLFLAFLLVVTVAIGVTAIAAERIASQELGSLARSVDEDYVQSLANQLGQYYEENGNWADVESVLSALPRTPGLLRLVDPTGATIAEVRPGPRGPGSGGPNRSESGDPANVASTPTPSEPTPGAADGPGSGPRGPAADVTSGAGQSNGSGGSGGGGAEGEPGGDDASGRDERQPSNATPAAPGPQGTPADASDRGGSAGDGTGPSSNEPGQGPIQQPTEATAPGGDQQGQPGGAGRLFGFIPFASVAHAQGTPVADNPAFEAPVFAGGQQVATLYLFTQQGASTSSEPFLDRVRVSLLVGGLASLALALLLAGLLLFSLTRPLRTLREASMRIASGDLSHRVSIAQPVEIADLGASFNSMAEALERDKVARQQLLADIAHELRTPLSIIQGTAQGFLDGVIAPDESHAKIIRDEAVLLARLISDLRDLSLAEVGRLKLDHKPCDMVELAKRAVVGIKQRARERDVVLEARLPESMPAVSVDAERVLEIMRNLLDNALRHSSDGGRIVLTLESRDGAVYLDVTDSGEGIAPEDVPHVFDRFYRGQKSGYGGSGTGLGLAIVKQLALAHGGNVSVSSEPGKGATFRVWLPSR